MGSGIFTRKAGELIFHKKIQQSIIDFTRLNIIKRSNRSTKEIIIIGIGKVTQFGIMLRHRDKQSNTQSNKRASERERRLGKRGRIKRQGWSGGEENERQMANNVMQEIRVCDGYLVCWLLRRLPSNGARNPSCYLLRNCVGFPLKRKGWCSKLA